MPDKAPSVDGMSNRMLQLVVREWGAYFTHLFQACVNLNYHPKYFKKVKKVAVSAPPGLAPSRSGKAPFAAFPSSIRTGSLPFTSISGSSPSTPSLASPCAFWLSRFQGLGDSPVLSNPSSLCPRPFALGPRRLVQFCIFPQAAFYPQPCRSPPQQYLPSYSLFEWVQEKPLMHITASATLPSLLLGLCTFTANHYPFRLSFCHVGHHLGLPFTRPISLCVARRTARS